MDKVRQSINQSYIKISLINCKLYLFGGRIWPQVWNLILCHCIKMSRVCNIYMRSNWRKSNRTIFQWNTIPTRRWLSYNQLNYCRCHLNHSWQDVGNVASSFVCLARNGDMKVAERMYVVFERMKECCLETLQCFKPPLKGNRWFKETNPWGIGYCWHCSLFQVVFIILRYSAFII